MNTEDKMSRRKALDGLGVGIAAMAATPVFNASGATAGGSGSTRGSKHMSPFWTLAANNSTGP